MSIFERQSTDADIDNQGFTIMVHFFLQSPAKRLT